MSLAGMPDRIAETIGQAAVPLRATVDCPETAQVVDRRVSAERTATAPNGSSIVVPVVSAGQPDDLGLSLRLAPTPVFEGQLGKLIEGRPSVGCPDLASYMEGLCKLILPGGVESTAEVRLGASETEFAYRVLPD